MNKKKLKTLRGIASQLPGMVYTAFHRGDIETERSIINKEGKDAYEKFRNNGAEKHRVNHFRRLKKSVNRLGFEKGVKAYCDRVARETGKEITLMEKIEG